MPFAGDLVLPDDAPHIVKRGRRITATGTINTVETGVIRIDDIPVRAGYAYEITCSNINIDLDTGTSIGLVRLRHAFSASTGTAANVSSTQLNSWRQFIDDSTNSNIVPWVNNYVPGSTGYLSVLFTLQRQGASGNLVWFCSSVDVLDVIVKEIGEDPGDAGVVI